MDTLDAQNALSGNSDACCHNTNSYFLLFNLAKVYRSTLLLFLRYIAVQ